VRIISKAQIKYFGIYRVFNIQEYCIYSKRNYVKDVKIILKMSLPFAEMCVGT
jgi:hypothetical protein